MLSEFLVAHRSELLALTRQKVAARSAPQLTETDLEGGVPAFLDQLGETLRISPITGDAIARTAGLHGRVLWRTGFTVAQVVHDYGD
ncbi:MAG TPA: hypothetical protein VIJ22_03860, partial [Polyangiaceae bacterium]